MGVSLFVGNLPWSYRDDDLRELFSEHGHISAVTVVTDSTTGSSRGFGFVEMADQSEAERAAVAVDGVAAGGRALKVSMAR